MNNRNSGSNIIRGTREVRRGGKAAAAFRVLLFAAAMLAAVLFAGCRVNVNPEIPVVTVFYENTPPATDDPYVAVPETPTAPPQLESPISFTDINFENAVREFLGRSLGNIYPSDLKDITHFSARVSGIYNINEIVYFTSLEELDLMGNRINDLTPIAALKNLKKLNIARNFTVITGNREKGLDISPLGALPLLEELDASNNLITDVSALASLNSLTWLDIQNNRLTTLDGLENCKALEYLNISNSFRIDADNNETGITDISPLAGLTSLKTLYMRNGMVSSLEPLCKLQSLEYLDATYNALRHLPNMSGMTGLTTLIVRFNNILDLDGLAMQRTVRVLDVRDNFIRDISVILLMRSLETVYVDGNPILDYRPLDMFETARKNRQ
ncbi:MAG: leucine-rich repeat domain-containing protein [Clostridia bacterium]|nr:leucine-rich repeat domain-containing protein [Clostridia bacterium]